MALVSEPVSPWHIVVGLLAAAAVILLLARGAFDRWRVLGRHPKTRLTALSLSSIAAILFAVASWNPLYVRKSDLGSMHLAVAVDVSDSVLRADGGWPMVRAQAHELIASNVAAMPEQVRGQGTASILTFGEGVVVVEQEIRLADLPNAFNGLNRNSFAIGKESDIGAGLARAGELIERANGRGAVLLISDGHQTVGDAWAEAKRLARRGIAVHVFPVEGRGPELAISAADLPRRANAGVETFVRGVLWNGSSREARATLTLSRNPGIEDADRFGKTLVSATSMSIPAGRWARFRQPVTFQGLGLQHIELLLARDGEGGQHRRRFFTHVNRPPKILAIGGDNRWVSALAPVAAVTQIRPEAFSDATNLRDYDAVVISGVPAHQFTGAALDVISNTVRHDGVGLMLMNGDHRKADDETKTVLMSYADTPLAPLLPVVSNPFREPSAHQVVILIDASGSMDGWPIEKAKEIARHIVQNLLHERDRLDVITFTVDAKHLIQNRAMGDDGKSDAVKQIDSIAASGGTDPSKALALIAKRKMTHCSLILISDGYFDRVAERPDCHATVFAIGHESVPPDSPLWELADPFPVNASFDPSRIKVPSLEPREKFFVSGSFTPQAVSMSLRQGDLPVPELPLQGTAMTYVKQDADLIAVRPKLAHPVLAYRKGGAGHVGVLTTAIPPPWLKSEEGVQTVRAWIAHVMPYTARERYDFQLVDHSDTIEVHISLIAQDGNVPTVDRLDGVIEIRGEAPVGVRLNADPVAPATFRGRIRVPRDAHAQDATLVLSESGTDALSRPQHIPILIPPSAAVETAPLKEAYSYGLNEPLLREIAASGGGTFDPPHNKSFLQEKTVEDRGEPLWPLLIVAAASCYLAAIALRRLDW